MGTFYSYITGQTSPLGEIVKERVIRRNFVVACMPNAGYPYLENNRTVFTSSPDYFAEITSGIGHNYADIIGGCCGTTPMHIKKLAKKMRNNTFNVVAAEVKNAKVELKEKVYNDFSDKLSNNKFVILAEFTGLAEELICEADGLYLVAPFNRSDIICDLLKQIHLKRILNY